MTYHRPILTAGTQLEAHTARKEAHMSDTPRTDAATRMAFSGEYMVPIQESQKLERELTDMRETFREYMQAENEWRASIFCEMHEINAARENFLALQKKAKEVLGL